MTVTKPEADLRVESLILGPVQTNCYIVSCPQTQFGVVIDPGADAEQIFEIVHANNLQIQYILLTHAHFDHVGAAGTVKSRYDVPICLHRDEKPVLDTIDQQTAMFGLPPVPSFSVDQWLTGGDELDCGGVNIRVLETPGHTPGGTSFYADSGVFVGDALFHHGIGRTDLPGGDFSRLLEGIRQELFTLPEDTEVFPGHGPSTTIGEEKQSNPFLVDRP